MNRKKTALRKLTASKIPQVTLAFWCIKIAATPLGDLLTKPLDHGGLDLSRFASSVVLAIAIILLIYFTPQRAETQALAKKRSSQRRS